MSDFLTVLELLIISWPVSWWTEWLELMDFLLSSPPTERVVKWLPTPLFRSRMPLVEFKWRSIWVIWCNSISLSESSISMRWCDLGLLDSFYWRSEAITFFVEDSPTKLVIALPVLSVQSDWFSNFLAAKVMRCTLPPWVSSGIVAAAFS